MLKRFRGLFYNDLSIDLGMANTLIYVKSRGIVATVTLSLHHRLPLPP